MINKPSNYILRVDLMNDILSDDTEEILYWAGKRLCQKYYQSEDTIKDLEEFFKNANWGTLTQIKTTKNSYCFTLAGESLNERLSNSKSEYSLESGFICEFVQLMTNHYCISEVKNSKNSINITINIDEKSKVK